MHRQEQSYPEFLNRLSMRLDRQYFPAELAEYTGNANFGWSSEQAFPKGERNALYDYMLQRALYTATNNPTAKDALNGQVVIDIACGPNHDFLRDVAFEYGARAYIGIDPNDLIPFYGHVLRVET